VPEIAADVSRLLRKDKGFSESQLAFKGEEITDHLGIPPCNDWHRYSTNHSLQFNKIYNGFLRRRNEQVGSFAWPASPENIRRFSIAMARRTMMLSKINFSETPSNGEIWEIRMQNTLSSSGYSTSQLDNYQIICIISPPLKLKL
jgi:hypothetical protein